MTYADAPEGRSGCADTLPAPAPRDFLSSYRPANVVQSAQPQEQEGSMSWRLMSDSGITALSEKSGVEWAKVTLSQSGNAYGEIDGDDNAYQVCTVCGEYERLKNPPEVEDFPLTRIKDRHAH